MITRLSSFLVHTLREDPADAEVPSHKLLVRAGYIRRVAPGVYTLLPLGLKVQRRVEAIVREEMDAIGGQEILLPALLPREPYETSGRWTEYGDALFRLKDRKGNDMLLGPTHEELFASLVKSECSSYKDLPLTLYQVQIKYRDEERPRAGILRGREFVMKDSYSFDLTDEGLEAAYQRHRVAYQRIFDRIGVEYVICAATSGAMGGSASEEFLAIAPSGEDTFVRASESDYAANVEAVITQPGTPSDPQAVPAMTTHTTGDTPTIDTLVEWAQGAGVADLIGHTPQAGDTLKNVVCKVRQPGGEWELYGIGVPGDRAVDMKRLEASLEPAEVQLLEDADFKNYPFLIRGYISPRAIIDNDGTYLVDPRIVEGTAWITGADVAGDHVVNMVCGRDFTPHGTIEAAEVCEGDPAPDNGGVLTLERGIEIGHIFQLGRKYTDAFELDILDADGKRARPTMGSYGIGVSRMVGVVAEQSHDEKGLKWPASIAPFDVHIVIANKAEDAIAGAGELAEQLDARGVAVLLDDRKASPGVKFKDAELLGMPLIVVAGRGWADGVVEVRDRHTGEATEVAVAEIGSYLLERLGR